VRRILAIVAVVTLASAVASSAPADAAPERSSHNAVEISVMTFNIFYGGDDLDLETGDFCQVADGCEASFDAVVATVLASGADVVGLQEAERNTRRLADSLGWYYDERNHLISRFPLIDPPGADGVYAFVEVAPGRVVAVANLHLTSDPYGPYAVRDGASVEEVMELERSVRLSEIQTLLEALPELERQQIPLFVTGDFNSPSHLDWTASVADARPDVPYAVSWPVAETLAAAGLHDSYRDAFPDPVARPGFTWTPGGPESAPEGQEVFDRIDWVLASGDVTTKTSRIVGEAGGPDVDVAMVPYPSDHRAVVSTFTVHPRSPRPFAAVEQRRVFVGDQLSVVVHLPNMRGAQVALRRAGPGRKNDFVAVQTIRRGVADIRLHFDTSKLRPGDYEAVLLTGRHETLTRSSFWLYKRDTPPSVARAARSYDVGEAIDVSWKAAPGLRRDWVAIYRCADGECAPNGDYLLWVYTNAAIEGRLQIGPSSFEGSESWPLPAGTYVVRLLTDDSYVDLATSRRFTIG
jgi:endonuclease/exonuclease/phosphatase family metal-dependent hydrolase